MQTFHLLLYFSLAVSRQRFSNGHLLVFICCFPNDSYISWESHFFWFGLVFIFGWQLIKVEIFGTGDILFCVSAFPPFFMRLKKDASSGEKDEVTQLFFMYQWLYVICKSTAVFLTHNDTVHSRHIYKNDWIFDYWLLRQLMCKLVLHSLQHAYFFTT